MRRETKLARDAARSHFERHRFAGEPALEEIADDVVGIGGAINRLLLLLTQLDPRRSTIAEWQRWKRELRRARAAIARLLVGPKRRRLHELTLVHIGFSAEERVELEKRLIAAGRWRPHVAPQLTTAPSGPVGRRGRPPRKKRPRRPRVPKFN